MHESVQPVFSTCSRGLLALSVSALLMLSSGFSQAAEPQAVTYAIESPRASESLLLGITRAGNRLVSVGERGHILYSDDAGNSWQQGKVPTRQMLTAVFFVDEQNGWAVGHDALILHSTDGGVSWSEQYRDTELEAPLLNVWFADAERGFAVGAYGTLLRTDDGGESWDDIGYELDNEDGYHLNAITKIKDAGLFIVGEMGAMFRSVDEGASWETVDSPYEGSLFGVLPTAQEQTLVVYGLRGHVYRSTDFGDSWQEIRLHTPQGSQFQFGLADGALLDDGELVIVGHGGAVLRSHDNGASFNVEIRADRQSYAGVVKRPDGSLLLIGQGGVHITESVANP